MRKVPVFLLLTVIILNFYSLTALYVIGGMKFFPKQAFYILCGFAFLFLLAQIDFRVFRFYAIPLYFSLLLTLVGVFLAGVAINSSKRWINIFGLFTVQPSELAKISLIVVESWLYERRLSNFEKFLYSTLLLLPYAIIVFIQPDMGTSMIFISIYFLILLFSLPYKYTLSLVAVTLSTIPFLLKILKPYQIERILTFFDPYRDPLGTGYNVLQSIIAVGSGKFLGKGISQSTMSKLNFVPVQYADFIFSSISEIWGFLGVVIVLLSYGYLLYFITETYNKTKNRFGKNILLGAFAMFFFQILINVGMNMGIMPVTGVPLPFLSFGGSSMLTNFIVLGLVVSVHNFKDEINL